MASYSPLSMATLGIVGGAMQPKIRRKIFVSYHHGGDQWYYNEFSRVFHDEWESVYDNSLDRQIDSDNTAYVMQRIRDNFIHGTSCTVVLIGAATYQRKYVDWEIKATLDKQHSLFGIILPSHSKSYDGKVIVPQRFFDNLSSGYASMMNWTDLSAQSLATAVNNAVAKPKSLIQNTMAMKPRNG